VLDNGYEILTTETKSETIGIDTPENLQKALAYLKDNSA
jgi:CMP-2-keto-3-deoxyoctulosonic acid synthetase